MFEKIESANPSLKHLRSFTAIKKIKVLLEQVSSAGAAQNLTPIFAASSLVRCDALEDPADYRPDHACHDEFNLRRRQFKDLNLNECVADKSTATSKNLTRRANHRHINNIARIKPAPGTGRGLLESCIQTSGI